MTNSTNLRVGLGHDTHRIELGGPMQLGGIVIECQLHLVGHSDADVLLHAITDALLGAAGLDDIGQLFPDTAAENRMRNSAEILLIVKSKIQQAGYAIINLDCVVRAELPKIAPHKDRIRKRIAELLEIEVDQIGLKGKTGEGCGEVGRGEIIEAICVALLTRNPGR